MEQVGLPFFMVCDTPQDVPDSVIDEFENITEACHTGSHNGIHRLGRIWDVMKMDENDALNVTIRRAWEFQTLGRVML